MPPRQDFGHLRKTKVREIILSNGCCAYWYISSASGFQVWSLALCKATQHSVHPTGGSLRVFKQFAWLEAGSVKAALSRPAHQRVTHTVSVHPTGGTLRVFKRFSRLEVGSVKMALSHPTHQRVTQAVRRYR